jgi:hypothetical protein
MSHDPAAAVIGAQTIEIGARALAASATAAPSVTALAPAGAEEVSAEAAAAFAAEAAAVLEAHAAAQQELMQAGAALIDIARRYERADSEAAGTVLSSASQISNQAFAAGASVGAGLARAQTLPGALGSAARTPLMANLIEGVAASNPSTTIPAVANAASTALGVGTAPLSAVSSLGQGGASAGAAAGPAAASTLAGDDQSTRDESDDQQANDQQSGEQLI